MRVMLDTNVLVSYLIFGSGTIAEVVDDIAANHTILISTYVADELREVVGRKWPNRLGAVECLLREASFETVLTPVAPVPGLFQIRDPKDYPVLYSAIVGLADVLVTGDKDFGDIQVESPEILTPAEYVVAYVE